MLRLDRPSFASLPARTLPHPWEDFASFVSRVAECMGYKNPQWVLRPEESTSSIHPFNLCMLREKAAYQFLGHLLQIDERALYRLTHHCFTLCMQDPAIVHAELPSEIKRPLLTRHTFQTFFNPYSAAKVCSACLAEEPTYSRLYWNVLPVVVCMRHSAFLVDRCPTCQCSIPLLRSSLTRCPKCKRGDYREAPIVPLLTEEFFEEGQALIWYHLGIEGATQDDSAINNRVSVLFDLLPWQYFRLLDAFRCILGPLFPDAPFLLGSAKMLALLHQHPRPHSTFSLEEWSVFIATFHWIFAAWPYNFFAFLDAFPSVQSSRVRKRDQERATGVQRDFGVFYEKWLYKRLEHPAFAFLREAFEDYLRSHYTAGEVTKRLLPFKEKPEEPMQERPYLTKVQARALLGIGEDVLQSLLRQGILRAIKKPIGISAKRTMFLIEKASADALQRAWDELVPLEILAQEHLGVTKAVVLALEDAGLLPSTRGPHSDGYKLRLYNQATIGQFKRTLLSHVVQPCEVPTGTMLPLTAFSSKAGVSLITLLKEIFDGHILPIEIDEGRPLFQRLVLPKEKIARFLDEYKQRQREKQDLLTLAEVVVNLGVGEKVLRRWVQWGLIEGEKLSIDGKKPSLLFRKPALENFRHNYIFTKEVAELLGIVPRTVSKYVQERLLHPIAKGKARVGGNYFIFRRDEVMALISSKNSSVIRKEGLF